VAQARFVIEVRIAAAIERVGDFLRHFPNQAEIHPLIAAIHPVAPHSRVSFGGEPLSEAAAPAAARYFRVTDRLRAGPLPFSIHYDVVMFEQGPQTLLFYVGQWPGIYLKNLTTWRRGDDGLTHLREEVWVLAPRLLLASVVRIAQKSHGQSLDRLKTRLEAATAA
jgi:hypothetical protein